MRGRCGECNSVYHSMEAHQRAVERDRLDLLYEMDVQAADDEWEQKHRVPRWPIHLFLGVWFIAAAAMVALVIWSYIP